MVKTKRSTKSKNNKTRKTKKKEHAVIKEFRKMLNKNPIDRMYITTMIEQIPPGKKYDAQRLTSTEDLFRKLNNVLTVAPDFNDTLLVGTPLSGIIVWAMGTPMGLGAFRRPKINAMFKKILTEWAKFLNSPASRYVLNDGPNGWFSKKALKKINIDEFKHNPNAKYFGFKSWNDFFTRKLVPGARPIYEPDNTKAIVSGFDCTIYKIASNIKKYSNFWIKSQPYSLMDMLNHEEKFADLFIGGDVFQAFLNPFNYHRWHSPISGTVIKAELVEGLYFSERADENVVNEKGLVFDTWVKRGEDPNDQDASEGYISQVQTRAIYYIKSDDPAIGTVCVMGIGMVEISTCTISKKMIPGYYVDKGEEIGYFQFGGSTSCLIFQKGVIKQFKRKSGFCPMGSLIAIAN